MPSLKIFITVFFVLIFNPVQSKLAATFEQNRIQYGEPIKIDPFPSKKGFTGYATYALNKDWKLKVFYADDLSKIEHMLPSAKSKLNRDEVRDWSLKIFAQEDRGVYKTQLNFPRVEGHFFDKGLIAYEYAVAGKPVQGYSGIKVLFYNDGEHFAAINPKAYL